MTVRARRTRARERRCETERAGGGRRSAFGGGFRADGRPARVLRDEGRRGVAKATLPVARPASAYFSQRARSLSRRAINTASLGGAPGPNALPPFLIPPHALLLLPLPRRALSPPPLRRLLTCHSTCALPSTVTNQLPPRCNLLPLLFISRFSLLRLSSGVSHRRSLSLPYSPPSPQPRSRSSMNFS